MLMQGVPRRSRGWQTTKRSTTTTSTANLVKLLPTGTALAFQALAPSFTNHGKCLAVNRYISGGLIAFCCAICALLSFTDKMGRPYYGIAMPLGFGGFIPFNYEKPPRRDTSSNDDDDYYEGDFDREELVRRRLRLRDFIHATLRVFVFLAVAAFSDAGIQTCPWKEALVNMPLGVGFIASFVFMIFPSTRKGVGYGADSAVDVTTTNTSSDDGDKADDDDKDKSKPCPEYAVRSVQHPEAPPDGHRAGLPRAGAVLHQPHGRSCGAASCLLTTSLVASCAASCVLLSFTDSLVSCHVDGGRL
uniref:Uncharacterized protein n=1 Tax=Leersia perrieri TaxID=77586 RepID=A0A0D9V109_9ORYZ